MKIAVTATCHNEVKFLPYFFRHYRSFADYIAIIDNNSTDGSLDICRRESNHIESLDTRNKHRIDELTNIKNNYWKKFRDFDWVFVVDIDEIVYHPYMRNFLLKNQNKYSVLAPIGYQMITERFPITNRQIYKNYPYGVRSTPEISQSLFSCCTFDKKCIINPKKIIDTNYAPGSHSANMQGDVAELQDPELKLLHYRCLGLDYLLNKNKMRADRLVSELTAQGYSVHYLKSEEELRNSFTQARSAVVDVVNEGKNYE